LTATRDSRLTDLSVVTTNNESVNVVDSGTALANTWGKGVGLVYNNTGNALISSGNYSFSINPDTGVITINNATESCAAGTCVKPWKVTYTTYNTSRPDWSTANDATIGLGEYGNWFKIIVIVGVAAVVLSLIFLSFGRKSSDGQAY
jgi:hypothetical protein